MCKNTHNELKINHEYQPKRQNILKSGPIWAHLTLHFVWWECRISLILTCNFQLNDRLVYTVVTRVPATRMISGGTVKGAKTLQSCL